MTIKLTESVPRAFRTAISQIFDNLLDVGVNLWRYNWRLVNKECRLSSGDWAGKGRGGTAGGTLGRWFI